MIRLLRYLLVGLTAFAVGISFVFHDVTYTTLEEITLNIDSYEGRWVDVETFAQTDEELGWTIGEPFEKKERVAFIKLQSLSAELDDLRDEMASQSSVDSYPRVKVRVLGRVENNCNDGITCCFGETMTLEEATVEVLSSPEVYFRPRSN